MIKRKKHGTWVRQKKKKTLARNAKYILMTPARSQTQRKRTQSMCMLACYLKLEEKGEKVT
jgi:hypothetical protein